jgi:hypothetical protein
MNKKLTRLFTIPTLIAVSLSTTALGLRPFVQPPTVSGFDVFGNYGDLDSIHLDSEVPVRTETASGLQTTTFDTLEGTVTVNLPDDLAAGDTISGTVIAEVKKEQPRDSVKNENPADQPTVMDELSGYVVEVAKQPPPSQTQANDSTPPCAGREQRKDNHSISLCRKWTIPEGVSRIPVVLKNRVGKVVSRTEVPVAPKGNVARVADDFSTPPVGQAGKPLSVKGPFDGDFANTRVTVANNTATFLASSPRKVVVESPRNLNGLAEIKIEYKGNTVAKCAYRSISVKLAADKLNLIKGEQTTLTVNLAGLMGLLSPISVQLTNKSPQTVSMGGGEKQTINVDPSDLNGDTFSTQRTLTGVQAGGFSITAVVDPIRSERANCIPETARKAPLELPNNKKSAPGLRSEVSVSDEDIQELDRKLVNFTHGLSNEEQQAMGLLLRRAAQVPADDSSGTDVKVSFFTAGSPSDNPVNEQGESTAPPGVKRPGSPGGMPGSQSDLVRVALGMGSVADRGTPPSLGATPGAPPAHPVNPRGGIADEDVPINRDPRVSDRPGPKPDPVKIDALTSKLRDFGNQLSPLEQGVMDWLLQRAAAPGPENLRAPGVNLYGTPGGRPPSPDRLQQEGTNEAREAARETGYPIGSPGGLPPLAQALGTAGRGDGINSKRWLLRF